MQGQKTLEINKEKPKPKPRKCTDSEIGKLVDMFKGKFRYGTFRAKIIL